MSAEHLRPLAGDAGASSPPTTAIPGGLDGPATWLHLVAPGMLLTRGLVLLALILTPWMTTAVYVTARARAAAAAMLLLHIAATVGALRRPGPWSAALLRALLATDALLCGAVIAADPRLQGPGVAIGLLVLTLGFEAGGWMGALSCAALVALGVGAAWFTVSGPFLFSPRLAFSSLLSVETLFAGVAAVPTAAPAFPTALSVETSFAGMAVLDTPAYWFPTVLTVETAFAGAPAIGSSAALFAPALVLALAALCIGSGVNLLRLRATRSEAVS